MFWITAAVEEEYASQGKPWGSLGRWNVIIQAGPGPRLLSAAARPGLNTNGYDLQLTSLLKSCSSGSSEPPNSLPGPGVSLTHREGAPEPHDPAELAACLSAAFGLSTQPGVETEAGLWSLVHPFRPHCSIPCPRTCLWGLKTLAHNNNLTSSYWQLISSLCVRVCSFLKTINSPAQITRQHVYKCTELKSLFFFFFFADDLNSFMEESAG